MNSHKKYGQLFISFKSRNSIAPAYSPISSLAPAFRLGLQNAINIMGFSPNIPLRETAPTYKKLLTSFSLKYFFILVSLLLLASTQTFAQDVYVDKSKDPPFIYDEVPVVVFIEGSGSFDIDIIYTNTNLLYINIVDLFNILKIPCLTNKKGDSIHGFIENESRPYLIDYKTKQIRVGAIIMNSQNGLVKEMGSLYLESSILSDAFGISLDFNYRSLSVKLKSKFELPLLKLMRLEKMRKNISKLRGEEIIADTNIHRNYHAFRFGMLDWAVGSYQTIKQPVINIISVGLGAEILCGEANISTFYNSQDSFNLRNLQYTWRWIDNDKKLIKQAILGKIPVQSIAFLSAPLIGGTIRNSPTTVRKASGYYTINEHTDPNWTVELYINDVLVDYTTADASGLYVFKIPIVYGYTIIKLKFYGPLGEERTEQRTLNIPYTFMPAKTFEYSVTAGLLDYVNSNQYGQANFNYGVARFLTIGGGLEYLSSIPNHPFIPYARLAIQPFSKMVINLEYNHGVNLKGLLNFYITKSAFLEINYTKCVKGQLATRINSLEERKATFSVPFRIKKLSGFIKINFNQSVYNPFSYYRSDFTLSIYYKQFSANASSQFNWVSKNSVYNTTNLSLSYRMRNGFTFRASTQYNFNNNSLVYCNAAIEKRISIVYLSASYERNILYKADNISVNVKYDLPFARTGFSTGYSNKKVSFAESASGSLAFGGGHHYVKANNISSNSKGGIILYPFLDINQNDKFDKGEPIIYLPSIKVGGGETVIGKKDSIVRIVNLNAFVSYNMEFSDNDLENIAWRFKHKTYSVLIDPNQFKKVYVPIIVVGEVSGMVYFNKENVKKGLGHIVVQIFDKKGKMVSQTQSESDGYYTYLGLRPGDYTIRVDEKQLENLKYQSAPLQHTMQIKVSKQGDIVDGLDFVLSALPEKTKTTTLMDSLYKELTTPESNTGNIPKDKVAVDSLNKLDNTIKALNKIIEEYARLKEKLRIKDSIANLPYITENCEDSVLINDTIINKSVPRDSIHKKEPLNINESKPSEKMITINTNDSIVIKDSVNNLNPIADSGNRNNITNNILKKDTVGIIPTIIKDSIKTEAQDYKIKKDSVTITDSVSKQSLFIDSNLKKDSIINSTNTIPTKDSIMVDKEGSYIKNEIDGRVITKDSNGIKGVEKINIVITDTKGKKTASISTDDSGNFTLFGLKPGEYNISIIPKQLKKFGYISSPPSLNIKISPDKEGCIINNLEFILTK